MEHPDQKLENATGGRNIWKNDFQHSLNMLQLANQKIGSNRIIYGDIDRPAPMTVFWSSHAQSLTKKWVKGMLTGPVTILQWSFVRNDQPRSETCRQIALAIRDEVTDLERAGIKIIQIDEPAIREGLPLKKEDWKAYLDWAVNAFRIASSGVQDDT